MAEKAIQKFGKQLKCAICLDSYNDPKLLQCFHVYCRQCLVKLVVRDQQGQLSLPCPICRHAMLIPDSGVAGLPSAFQTNELLEIYDDLKMANSTAADNKGAEGDPPRPTPSKKVHYCSEHDGRELELYCETCEELICLRCAYKGGKHHSHNSDMLEDVFEKYKEEIVSSLKPLEENLKIINKALICLNKHSEEISNQQTDIEDSIHNTVQQLHEFIDVRKTELLGQLHQMTQDKLKDLSVQRNRMKTIQGQLSSCLDFVTENLQADYLGEVLKMKTAIVKQIKDITASFQPEILKPNTEADLEFSIFPNIPVICRNYGILYSSPTMPDLSKCHATGKGLEAAVVGEKSSALLHAINFSGQQCERPIESLQCELVSEITGAIVRGHVERRGQNRYKISYQPSIKGKHQLHIKIEGQHVRDSPFTVTVMLPVENLGTPILAIKHPKNPRGVAISQRGEIVVTEFMGHCVSVFNPSGVKLHSFGTLGSDRGQFSSPCGVAVDGVGNILVTDSDNHRVQKFTMDGQFIEVVGSKGYRPLQFFKPLSIAFNAANNKVYVGDYNHHIQVLNSDLTFSHTFKKKGNGKGQFDHPSGVACDSTGKVYVADCYDNHIQVFTAKGKFLKMFGKFGTERGELFNPVSISVDTCDMLYVSERLNHRISVFTSEGQFVTSFGKEGEGTGEFKHPQGLTVDKDGVVYVCDSDNNRFQVF